MSTAATARRSQCEIQSFHKNVIYITGESQSDGEIARGRQDSRISSWKEVPTRGITSAVRGGKRSRVCPALSVFDWELFFIGEKKVKTLAGWWPFLHGETGERKYA